MTKFTQTYPTDLKYSEWLLIAQFFTPCRRGRPPKNASASAPAGSAAAIARDLSNAAQALVAHISRLESELAESRKDRERLAAIERALGR